MAGRKRERLAERRRIVGLSQERLAEAVGVDTSTVARWERGETEPQPVHRPRLAEALGVSAEEVAALLSRSDQTATATGRTDEGDEFAVPLTPAGRAVGPEGLPGSEVYASALRSFRVTDRQVGGRHLYATVVSYLHREVAPALFGDESGGDGQGVFTAAAALTEMAGWMAHDAGRDETAREHLVRSHDLARVGNDRQLRAHVLASMSHLAHHGRRPGEAIRLARRGREGLSGGPQQPELVAFLLALEARGLAALGQARDCVQLLGRAETALTAPPDEPRSPWVTRFDEGALANEAARSLSRLGEFRAAGGQAEQIIALRPRDRTRSRAFGQLMLVTVLLAQGRLDEACAVAHEVLTDTPHLGSYLVVRELAGLRQRLEVHRATPAAATFLDSLEEALRERRWLVPGEERGQPAGAAGRP
jgi:transcriptional regulator with XRE-family HTH domain